MGWIDRLIAPQEKRSLTWHSLASVGGTATSGIYVNDAVAMSCTAVFACNRVLAESLASLRLEVKRRLPKGGMEDASDHPLMPVLRDRWNVAMSSFVARETMQGHLGLRGNAFAYIERRGKQIVGLWPLRPDQMMAQITEARDGSVIVSYLYRTATNGAVEFQPRDILHIPALGGDGIMGLAPVTLFRQSIGLALATEEAGSRFFGNSARPSGVYEHPQKLSPDAYKRLKESLDAQNAGVANTGRTVLLEEGMKWTQVGLSNEDSQYLETRSFQVQDIARIYRVPPHMIGAATADSQTYANVEQRSMEFLQYTVMPWVERWTQELEHKLLTPKERESYAIRFDLDDIVKADLKTRFEAYKIGLDARFLTRNEVREEEEMPPLPGGEAIDAATGPAAPTGGAA